MSTCVKVVCSECGEEVANSWMIKHILKCHSGLSLFEQAMIHQNSSLNDSAVKIQYMPEEFLKKLFVRENIQDLKEYNAVAYKYAQKINNFCRMIEQYRTLEAVDVEVFFGPYLEYKKDHPAVNTSFELAKIACTNHSEQTDDFYEKVIKPRNPYTGHGSELSPWSKDFKSYQGMTDSEKRKMIRQRVFCKDREDFDELKKNCNCTLEYYLNKGMCEEEAKVALKERQSTFSLKKCIEKYGEEEGTRRFKERQEKWLKSLDTPENKEKIKQGQLKGFKSTMGKGYSEISQQLFNAIRDRLPEITDMLYATNGGEYIVDCSPVKHPMLDFYIPSLKCWIEFDGDYWHGEARGNQERDRKREEAIKKVMPSIKLKRVSERDFKTNPELIIDECVEWIKENYVI